MPSKAKMKTRMAESIFTLRQKCIAKDMYFVHNFCISLAEYNCLVLFFTQENYGVKDLAAALDITPGGVTRIITSLEKRGIIKRRISPEDRRNIDVSLTAKGKRMVIELRNASMELHGKILNQIEPELQEPVVDALEHLIDAIDFWIEEHQETKK